DERPDRRARRRGSRRLPPMREELVDAVRRMLLHAREHVGQVRDRVDSVLLAGCDERIEDGEVLSGVLVTEEEVVRASESNAAKRGLRDVVVRRDRRMTEEAAERSPVTEQVADR